MLIERPKLSDPARGTRGLQPERDGRVRWSAWLGCVNLIKQKSARHDARILLVNVVALRFSVVPGGKTGNLPSVLTALFENDEVV